MALNITRENFKDFFPVICHSIEACDFISVDTEFNRLHLPGYDKSGNRDLTLFESGPERYEKLRQICQHTVITQIGISTFEQIKVEQKNVFKVNSYNVFVHLVAFGEFNKGYKVEFEPECREFLETAKFDFEKFYKGAPYLNKEDEICLENFFSRNPNALDDFYRGNSGKDYFPNREDMNVEDLVDFFRGVSKLITKISECKKPLIGHNLLRDLMLIYHQFIEYLSESYEDFKSKMIQNFSQIYDTKFISKKLYDTMNHKTLRGNIDRKHLKGSSLFNLFKELSSIEDQYMPYFVLENCDTYRSEMVRAEKVNVDDKSAVSMCHQAGFDSLVTGATFLKLSITSFRLCKDFCNRKSVPSFKEMVEELSTMKNLICVQQAAVPHINLNGKDAFSKRPPWLKVIDKDSKMKNCIEELKLKYGPLDIKPEGSNIIIASTGLAGWRNMKKYLIEKNFQVFNVYFDESQKKKANAKERIRD